MVSVLIPVHNNVDFITSALRSISNQTMPDLEIVVVDDGSTDGTAEALSSYKDPRMRVHAHEHQKGVGAARNTAVSLATGDFFAWMDGDDISLPQRLERQLMYFESHPTAQVVGTDLFPVDMKGRLTGRPWMPPQNQMLIKWGYVFGTPMINGTTMARRSVYENEGGYDETLAVGEDNDFWLRRSWNIEMANLHEILLLYRRHPKNTTFIQLEQSATTGARLTKDVIEKLIGGAVDIKLASILRAPLSMTSADIHSGHARAAQALLRLTADRFDLHWSPTPTDKKLLREARSLHALRLWLAASQQGRSLLKHASVLPPLKPTDCVRSAHILFQREISRLKQSSKTQLLETTLQHHK